MFKEALTCQFSGNWLQFINDLLKEQNIPSLETTIPELELKLTQGGMEDCLVFLDPWPWENPSSPPCRYWADLEPLLKVLKDGRNQTVVVLPTLLIGDTAQKEAEAAAWFKQQHPEVMVVSRNQRSRKDKTWSTYSFIDVWDCLQYDSWPKTTLVINGQDFRELTSGDQETD